MPYIITAIAFSIMIIYILNEKKNSKRDLFYDIPSININNESLEKYALEISQNASETKANNCRRKMNRSLNKSYRKILEVFEYIDRDVRNKREIVGAAEWLVDNLYLIEKEYKDIKFNTPQGYYKNIPVITKGMMKGYPRVYYIAVQIISYTHGKVTSKIIENFIENYQKNSVLTSSELWALPTMVRIALIQNISKVAQRIVYAQKEKNKADELTEKLMDVINSNKNIEEFSNLINQDDMLSSHFTERLLKNLRDSGIENNDIYNWVEKKLEIQETDSEKMINLEHQNQADFQLSMASCITGLREIEALNWNDSFEKLSYVEQILRNDPSKVYDKMDFSSRDFYRHKIEKLSKKIKIPESFIAKKLVECAAKNEGNEDYKKHIGYYLVDEGINCLKKQINYKENFIQKINKNMRKHKDVYYISTIIISTLIIMVALLVTSYINDTNVAIWKYIIAFLTILIPTSEIVISILNWSINHLTHPDFIPKMELNNNIPEHCKTAIVIPTLLNNEKRVHELTESLEVYYLANSQKNLYFALLGDFKDSDKEHEESDSKIVDTALKDIELLNEKYCSGKENIFYFFNRYRQYNKKENKWLGWERKRGKIMEFNALIRGNKNTSYNVISSDIKPLLKVKYVLTLDADTQLPRDSAKELIGAMSHVLNRAVLDKNGKKVLRGYGLMQPRINVSAVSANKTFYSRIFSGETGIDTYTTAVSDVYQDLFKEGIFTGKGIYDVDIFNSTLKDEIPENTVLSHDLLEGSYVRCALVTDIELIDGYPAYYTSAAKRLHRWVRGDWQIISWIFKKTTLNRISKWKIIDNLRRSLFSPSIIILTALSMQVLPQGPDKWIPLAFVSLVTPILFNVSEAVVSPIKGVSLSGKINDGKTVLEQVFLIFTFLPHMTYLMLDAIFRTIYRITISKKNLLEWQTAADVEASCGRNLKSYVYNMWQGSVIAILLLVLSFARATSIGFFVLPSCILWFLSPLVAYYVGKNIKKETVELTEEQKQIVRKISRKTYAYFEDFVGEETNWLAPDNYQEEPDKGIAYRTSPTNMAMGLTSNIVARDLGYISFVEMITKIDKILLSMESLEKYKGHFYNWYDIETKKPMKPRYISTVDSGNLVGYLWVIQQSLKEYEEVPILNKKYLLGLSDTLKLANTEIENTLNIKEFYTNDIKNVEHINIDIFTWEKVLTNLLEKNKKLEIDKENKELCKLLFWNKKVKNMAEGYLKEVSILFPWINILNEKANDMEQFIEKNKIIEKLKLISSSIPLKNIVKENNKIINYIASMNYNDKKVLDWESRLVETLQEGKSNIEKLINKIYDLKNRLSEMAENTDFKMLFDKERQLFSIGYDVEKDTLGKCYYDLLASEARAASFIAIAKGDVEQLHWFKLGRSMTIMGKMKGLVSWSGTMFEYFMPLIIMKTYPDTLLSLTYKGVIEAQKRYCKLKGIPWGISESAYYSFDPTLNYQYKAFGVPGIGLKRGLANDCVISPYSTILAMQLDLQGGVKNLKRLEQEKAEGKYGFYDAIDYTKERLPKVSNKLVVKNFMVHHQGMSLMALDNILNKNILQERFHELPRVKSTELLLQERVPNRIIYDRNQSYDISDLNVENLNVIVRTYDTAKTIIPEITLLSNGRYSTVITNSGSGYSKMNDVNINRWSEDVTLNNRGMFFYIRDVNDDKYWSATYQPCKVEGEEYLATFSLDKVEFKRKDGDIITKTKIAVSNEDNAEVRKIFITNKSKKEKIIEITSYNEITLTTQVADAVHPAFSNLFIMTEFLNNPSCIIANRRPRTKSDKRNWIMQNVVVEGNTIGNMEYETSRVNFIGRNKNLEMPEVIEKNVQLKNTVGAVLDPIISIRRKVRIAPDETCKISYVTAVGNSRDEVVKLAKKYEEPENINRIFQLALTQTQVEMQYLGIKYLQANLYQFMASRIMFLNPLLKKRQKYIKNVTKGQPVLWGYGISGDLPIVLLKVKKVSDKGLVKQMLNAHQYLNLKGLKFDLVILDLENNSYENKLRNVITDLINAYSRDNGGAVYLFNEATIKKEDIELLMGISRLVIDSEDGLLIKQLKYEKENINVEDLKTIHKDYKAKKFHYDIPKLECFNEYGGFDTKNNEYVIHLKDGKNTPAPWINVISNNQFGFQVSEVGSSYTWYKNSRENKITPWSNDWVKDTPGEILYLRDEYTGQIWNINPKPIREKNEYIIQHGYGYSIFKHESNGIIGETIMFVPKDESVKINIVTLKNNTNIKRKLSLTYYAQMVLGVVPEQTSTHIATYLDKENKYIYCQNPYNENFKNMYAYLKIFGGNEESFTGDRKEFIGREGSIENPLALNKKTLSNNCGAGFDPCMAENAKIEIEPGKELQLVIAFGEDESKESILNILSKYSNIQNAFNALEEEKEFWSSLLQKIQVKTPDKTMDIMLNGWLLYQNISCRLWSRTAFYQSGGAYGFRDQLQDVMSLSYIKPEMTRKQIIYSASRQFCEGDVQHWWHPVVDSGIRTRFSDDLLWLPYVTADYIQNTGDYSVLKEEAYYLEDEPLKDNEDERYTISRKSDKKGSIYEHCIKAIEKSLKFGIHNIPLMGSGDWNDGMSTVGNKGKGESVWLGWFLYSILDSFTKICKFKNDEYRVQRYDEIKEFIRENIEKNAWDGKWYRRAYFDNGEPMGASVNDECQIDSLAQTWAVISNGGSKSRIKEAMSSLESHLMLEDKNMILLFTPAFNNSKLEPGYIKGYIPGVRENGGQYTHAATWVILAFAKINDGFKAWKAFSMINPINHTKSYLDCQNYKVEPYVIAADVYSTDSHKGRGGWTWYTGSAGWMYRAGIEAILGLKLQNGKGFTIEPVIPDSWPGFEITYKKENYTYNIKVTKGENKKVLLDKKELSSDIIPFMEEGIHEVQVIIEPSKVKVL